MARCGRKKKCASGFAGLKKVTDITDVVKVYRDTETGEYVARAKGQRDSDYYTDIRSDAEETALRMAGVARQEFNILVLREGKAPKMVPAFWTVVRGHRALQWLVDNVPWCSITAEQLRAGERKCTVGWFSSSPTTHTQTIDETSMPLVWVMFDEFSSKTSSSLKGLPTAALVAASIPMGIPGVPFIGVDVDEDARRITVVAENEGDIEYDALMSAGIRMKSAHVMHVELWRNQPRSYLLAFAEGSTNHGERDDGRKVMTEASFRQLIETGIARCWDTSRVSINNPKLREQLSVALDQMLGQGLMGLAGKSLGAMTEEDLDRASQRRRRYDQDEDGDEDELEAGTDDEGVPDEDGDPAEAAKAFRPKTKVELEAFRRALDEKEASKRPARGSKSTFTKRSGASSQLVADNGGRLLFQVNPDITEKSRRAAFMAFPLELRDGVRRFKLINEDFNMGFLEYAEVTESGDIAPLVPIAAKKRILIQPKAEAPLSPAPATPAAELEPLPDPASLMPRGPTPKPAPTGPERIHQSELLRFQYAKNEGDDVLEYLFRLPRLSDVSPLEKLLAAQEVVALLPRTITIDGVALERGHLLTLGNGELVISYRALKVKGAYVPPTASKEDVDAFDAELEFWARRRDANKVTVKPDLLQPWGEDVNHTQLIVPRATWKGRELTQVIFRHRRGDRFVSGDGKGIGPFKVEIAALRADPTKFDVVPINGSKGRMELGLTEASALSVWLGKNLVSGLGELGAEPKGTTFKFDAADLVSEIDVSEYTETSSRRVRALDFEIQDFWEGQAYAVLGLEGFDGAFGVRPLIEQLRKGWVTINVRTMYMDGLGKLRWTPEAHQRLLVWLDQMEELGVLARGFSPMPIRHFGDALGDTTSHTFDVLIHDVEAEWNTDWRKVGTIETPFPTFMKNLGLTGAETSALYAWMDTPKTLNTISGLIETFLGRTVGFTDPLRFNNSVFGPGRPRGRLPGWEAEVVTEDGHYYTVHIVPPQHVAVAHARGEILTVPGMMDDAGLVVKTTFKWGKSVSGKSYKRRSKKLVKASKLKDAERVAVDQNLEKGLAGLGAEVFGPIYFKLTPSDFSHFEMTENGMDVSKELGDRILVSVGGPNQIIWWDVERWSSTYSIQLPTLSFQTAGVFTPEVRQSGLVRGATGPSGHLSFQLTPEALARFQVWLDSKEEGGALFGLAGTPTIIRNVQHLKLGPDASGVLNVTHASRRKVLEVEFLNPEYDGRSEQGMVEWLVRTSGVKRSDTHYDVYYQTPYDTLRRIMAGNGDAGDTKFHDPKDREAVLVWLDQREEQGHLRGLGADAYVSESYHPFFHVRREDLEIGEATTTTAFPMASPTPLEFVEFSVVRKPSDSNSFLPFLAVQLTFPRTYGGDSNPRAERFTQFTNQPNLRVDRLLTFTRARNDRTWALEDWTTHQTVTIKLTDKVYREFQVWLDAALSEPPVL